MGASHPVRAVSNRNLVGRTVRCSPWDGILVSTRILFVGLYRECRPNVADSVTNISMLHVTELVPLAATLTEPATTN